MASLCPSCGQRLPKGAAHCPACGASTTALPVEEAYEPIGGDPLVTIGGGGTKRRRGWLLAAVLVVTLGVGALIAGRATDDATSAPSTTTTVRPTTTSPPTTRSTRSTTPRATTTTQAITRIGAPVLPEPTGESLYTINATGDVYRVDLDTGLTTHSKVGRAFQDAAVVALDNGALVLNLFPNSDSGIDRETVMYHVRVDGSVEEVTVPVPSAGRMGAPGIGVWLYNMVDTTQTATLVTAEGETVVSLTMPAGAQSFIPDGDGIAFLSGSGIYRIDQQGIRRIATGELIAMSARFMVVSNCDDAYRCTVTRVDRTSGQIDAIGERPGGLSPYYQSGSLSPDGTMVSMLVYGNTTPPRIHIYDLTTNTVQVTGTGDFGMQGTQAWTTSGWSASVDGDSDVVLVRGGDTRSVDLPSSRSGPGPLAIAVGPTPLGAGIGPP
jgi:hypothetical protein